MSDSQGQPAPRGGTPVPVITDARTPTSVEHDSRVKKYALTMSFRTACFVSMIFVEGPLRWVLFAGAVVLPYVAVIIANQANQRRGETRLSSVPSDRPQLTTGPEDAEVISGAISDGDEPVDRDAKDRDRKVA